MLNASFLTGIGFLLLQCSLGSFCSALISILCTAQPLVNSSSNFTVCCFTSQWISPDRLFISHTRTSHYMLQVINIITETLQHRKESIVKFSKFFFNTWRLNGVNTVEYSYAWSTFAVKEHFSLTTLLSVISHQQLVSL